MAKGAGKGSLCNASGMDWPVGDRAVGSSPGELGTILLQEQTDTSTICSSIGGGEE